MQAVRSQRSEVTLQYGNVQVRVMLISIMHSKTHPLNRSTSLSAGLQQANISLTSFGFNLIKLLAVRLYSARIRTRSLSLCIPSKPLLTSASPSNKAVAEGAVSFYIDHYVCTRVARFNYGTSCNVVYEPDKPSHASRAHRVYEGADGATRLTNHFYCLLNKVSFLWSSRAEI